MQEKSLDTLADEINEIALTMYKQYRKLGWLEYKRYMSVDELAKTYQKHACVEFDMFKEVLQKGYLQSGEFN